MHKSDDCFVEQNRVPIQGVYDVIIAGGGVAGVSAALAARRNGCSTLLVEKSVMLGGLATLGHVVIYLPLCDGRGRKIIGGIAEELLHLSIKYGYDNLPFQWREGGSVMEEQARYRTVFNAPAFAVALDEIMMDAGVDLLFDTCFSMPVIEDGYCKGIVVENKSGRTAYAGSVVVDTTGDADVLYRAGAQCVESDNWLSYWGYQTDMKRIDEALTTRDLVKLVGIMALGGDCTGRGTPDGARKYRGTDAQEVSKFILEGRKLVREQLINKGREEHCVLALPGMAQYRTTRRIQGLYELQPDDVYKRFDDSIGCTGDWRKAGPVYEIPYRTLISTGLHNMITAGRTIAALGDAWEVTRVIPTAALTGQAAGTAAAIAVQQKCPIEDVGIQLLQQQLSADGVMIHHQ